MTAIPFKNIQHDLIVCFHGNTRFILVLEIKFVERKLFLLIFSSTSSNDAMPRM